MFTIPRHSKDISNICLNEKCDGKEPLRRVSVRAEGENTIITALDGHILVELTTPNRSKDMPEIPGLPLPDGNTRTLIPTKDWNQIIKSLPTKPLHPILENAIVVPTKHQGAAVGITDLKSTKVMYTQNMVSWIDQETKKEKTEEFPEYEQLFNGDEVIQEIVVDPNLIAKIFQTIASMGFKRITLAIPENPDFAIEIHGTNGEDTIRALFMPCKKPD